MEYKNNGGFVINNININSNAQKLIDILEQNGFEGYIVGGCVRDSLLCKTPHDFDICTNATPVQMKICFKDFQVIETGIAHGTLTVMVEHEPFEVTTYRVDGEYLDSRHPVGVEFVSSLKEDLSRRDFTINAMAYNSKTGLVDYFGGQADLENKLIRCVGNPDTRFGEDALRILRALRFACVYGLSIEKSASDSIHSLKNLLKNISPERINAELCKLICGKGVEQILIEYIDVLGVFIPEILGTKGFKQNNPHHIYDVWTHIVKSVAYIPPEKNLRLTMLFHDIGKPVSYTKGEDGVGHFYGHPRHSSEMAVSIMKRLKFDSDTIEQVKKLVLYHDDDIIADNKHIKRWLNKIGEDNLRKLILVKKADLSAKSDMKKKQQEIYLNLCLERLDEVIKQGECFSLKDLSVDGKDLMQIGISQGKTIGIVLNHLMDMVIDEKVENDKVKLINLVKKLYL